MVFVTDLAATLTALLEPASQDHGFELVAVEIAGGHHAPIVRVFLDRVGGVTLDDIAAANAWVSPLLEEHPGLRGPFTLELSSPGIDRPLRTRTDLERSAGQRAKIKTAEPIDGRSAFTGIIVGMDGEDVVLDCDGVKQHIPLSGIRKANLKTDIDLGNDEGVPR